MNGNRKHLTACCLLIVLNLAFIWGNSMQSARVSSGISMGLLGRLPVFLAMFGELAEFILRKLAHFSEFACLGLLLARASVLAGERGLHRFSMPLLLGTLAACVDETIQMFVEGRDSSLRDVWIDTAGVVTGILVLTVLVYLLSLRTKRK